MGGSAVGGTAAGRRGRSGDVREGRGAGRGLRVLVVDKWRWLCRGARDRWAPSRAAGRLRGRRRRERESARGGRRGEGYRGRCACALTEDGGRCLRLTRRAAPRLCPPRPPAAAAATSATARESVVKPPPAGAQGVARPPPATSSIDDDALNSLAHCVDFRAASTFARSAPPQPRAHARTSRARLLRRAANKPRGGRARAPAAPPRCPLPPFHGRELPLRSRATRATRAIRARRRPRSRRGGGGGGGGGSSGRGGWEGRGEGGGGGGRGGEVARRLRLQRAREREVRVPVDRRGRLPQCARGAISTLPGPGGAQPGLLGLRPSVSGPRSQARFGTALRHSELHSGPLRDCTAPRRARDANGSAGRGGAERGPRASGGGRRGRRRRAGGRRARPRRPRAALEGPRRWRRVPRAAADRAPRRARCAPRPPARAAR